MFDGVFSRAGQVRQYNITKKEWVLNGDTVTYADWNSIRDICMLIVWLKRAPKVSPSKFQFDTLDCTLEELALLELIAKNPFVKQQELVEAAGKSLRTVKRLMKALQEKQYIRRESGKRYGKWELMEESSTKQDLDCL